MCFLLYWIAGDVVEEEEDAVLKSKESYVEKIPTGHIVGIIRRKWRQYCGILQQNQIKGVSSISLHHIKKEPSVRKNIQWSVVLVNLFLVLNAWELYLNLALGLPSLLYNEYWVFFPGVKWLDMALATDLHLVPRLKTFDYLSARMSKTISLNQTCEVAVWPFTVPMDWTGTQQVKFSWQLVNKGYEFVRKTSVGMVCLWSYYEGRSCYKCLKKCSGKYLDPKPKVSCWLI